MAIRSGRDSRRHRALRACRDRDQRAFRPCLLRPSRYHLRAQIRRLAGHALRGDDSDRCRQLSCLRRGKAHARLAGPRRGLGHAGRRAGSACRCPRLARLPRSFRPGRADDASRSDEPPIPTVRPCAHCGLGRASLCHAAGRGPAPPGRD